jgi:hypothetical protein
VKHNIPISYIKKLFYKLTVFHLVTEKGINMRNILEDAWKIVGIFFKEHKINSERALQAVLYHALQNRISEELRIFVEPQIVKYRLNGSKEPIDNAFVPDIVITNSDSVKCIMEIKFSPHNDFNKGLIEKDFRKFEQYQNKFDRKFYLDEFGERRVFDKKNKKWNPETIELRYDINEETVYCFAVLGLKDDINLIEAINKNYSNKNMCILAGFVEPNIQDNINKFEFNVVKEYLTLKDSSAPLTHKCDICNR